jgi:hypothetical protein
MIKSHTDNLLNNPLFPALRSGPTAVSAAPAKSKFLAAKLEVGYDYRDYFEERFTVFPNTVLQDTTWGGEDTWGEQDTLWGGDSDGVYQFQIRPRQQRCQALKLKIEDFFNTGSGTAGFALSNVTAEVGIEPNIARLNKTKIIAP